MDKDLLKKWSAFNPVIINFGRGVRVDLKRELIGRQGIIVTSPRGKKQLKNDPVLGKIFVNNKQWLWIDDIQSNPEIVTLEKSILKFNNFTPEVVLAFGGGSVIDSAKVIAISMASKIYDIKKLLLDPDATNKRTIPLYAIPTTSGTGSETTPFATVWDHKDHRKYSLAGPAVYPYSAFVDSELTDGLPDLITVSTGLDAINQAAESIWNKNMTTLTEATAGRALKLGLTALHSLIKDPKDNNSRDDMAEASLLAGMAISQTHTSLCHSISYPLTTHFGIPHGLACAFTMPAVLRLNLSADDGRFIRLACLLNDNPKSTQYDLIKKFDALNKELCVSSHIKNFVGNIDQLLDLSIEMQTPGRSDNNLVSVDDSDIRNILKSSWG